MRVISDEQFSRPVCTDDRLKLLRKQGFETNGYRGSLEEILKSKGFGFPVWDEDMEGYAFTINYRLIRSYLNYADALAEEILLLRKLQML